jgi:hypothetical protein
MSKKIMIQRDKIDAKSMLDLVGRDFNFDHSKGVAEWIKNSEDAYQVSKSKDRSIFIIVDSKGANSLTEISVLDFCGMSYKKINDGFKNWFSETASKLSASGEKTNLRSMRGGHGNGGKYYMRQMFKTSFIKTYFDGSYSEFAFDEDKNYGFVEDNENSEIRGKAALITSGITEIASLMYTEKDHTKTLKGLLGEVELGKTGFTLVTGIKPVKRGVRININTLMERIITNPQASQIIEHSSVYFIHKRGLKLFKLEKTKIKPRKGFEDTLKISIPSTLKFKDQEYRLFDDNDYGKFNLRLNSSENPLVAENKPSNMINFLGEIGIIASYSLHEINKYNNTSSMDFIYGECDSSFIDKKYIKNDRSSFVRDHGLIEALLDWVSEKLIEYSKAMDQKNREEKKKNDLSDAGNFNDMLNTWKNKFLESLSSEEKNFGNDTDNHGFGGDEFDLDWKSDEKKKKKKKGSKKRKKAGDKGGEKKKNVSKFPTIYLSDHDKDPSSGGKETFSLDRRHPVIHQRPYDVENNIYWINTNKDFASNIISKYGVKSYEWKQYNFERVKDVILLEAIEIYSKKNIDMEANAVKNLINDTISKIFNEEKLISLILDN